MGTFGKTGNVVFTVVLLLNICCSCVTMPSQGGSYTTPAVKETQDVASIIEQGKINFRRSMTGSDSVCSQNEILLRSTCYNDSFWKYKDGLSKESLVIDNLVTSIMASLGAYTSGGFHTEYTDMLPIFSFGPPIGLYDASRLKLMGFGERDQTGLGEMQNYRNYSEIMNIFRRNPATTSDLLKLQCDESNKLTTCFRELFKDSECYPTEEKLISVANGMVCNEMFSDLIFNKTDCLIEVNTDDEVEECLLKVNESALETIHTALIKYGRNISDSLCEITDMALECLRPVTDKCGPEIREHSQRISYQTMSVRFNIDCTINRASSAAIATGNSTEDVELLPNSQKSKDTYITNRLGKRSLKMNNG